MNYSIGDLEDPSDTTSEMKRGDFKSSRKFIEALKAKKVPVAGNFFTIAKGILLEKGTSID